MTDLTYVQQGPLAYRFADDVVIVHLASLPNGNVADIELPAKVVLDHIATGRALRAANGHPPIIDLVQQERDALRLRLDEEVASHANTIEVMNQLTDVITKERTPNHWFNADNWDCTYQDEIRSDLFEDLLIGEVMEVGCLRRLPNQWAARVPLDFDEEGDATDDVIRFFPTEAAAHGAALARPITEQESR